MEIVKLLYANKLRLKNGKLLGTGFAISMGYSLLLLIMNYIELKGHVGDSIVAITWYLLSPFSTVSAFCPVFCSIFIGTDYSNGTIRNKLIAGHTRRNIYLANFITVSAVHIALLLATDIVTAILGTLMFGWHMLYPGLFLLHFFSGILMLAALSGLFTLTATLIQNQTYSGIWGLTIFAALFMAENAVLRVINARLDGKAEMVETGIFSEPVLEFIYDFIPLGQLLQVSRGMILHSVRMPVLSLIFTALTVLCGIAVFGKKDFK